jgi:GNAT superfamily N-acetyltransferase
VRECWDGGADHTSPTQRREHCSSHRQEATTAHPRLGDGTRPLRPIKPADEHLYGDFVAKLSRADIRLRFLTPRKEFSHKFVARFTQIDYSRAMAFVALDEKELLGVARLGADPDYVTGEYAIIVRSDLKGTGMGWALMRHLIRYAEKEGLRELTGDVLAANHRMLDRARLRDRRRSRGRLDTQGAAQAPHDLTRRSEPRPRTGLGPRIVIARDPA